MFEINNLRQSLVCSSEPIKRRKRDEKRKNFLFKPNISSIDLNLPFSNTTLTNDGKRSKISETIYRRLDAGFNVHLHGFFPFTQFVSYILKDTALLDKYTVINVIHVHEFELFEKFIQKIKTVKGGLLVLNGLDNKLLLSNKRQRILSTEIKCALVMTSCNANISLYWDPETRDNFNLFEISYETFEKITVEVYQASLFGNKKQQAYSNLVNFLKIQSYRIRRIFEEVTAILKADKDLELDAIAKELVKDYVVSRQEEAREALDIFVENNFVKVNNKGIAKIGVGWNVIEEVFEERLFY